jgi:hypothetical protein
MESELSFRGKKITERERRLLEDIFEEKIHDLYLCQSILLAAMRPEQVLARAAFTRALTNEYCAYADGGREARKLIRRIRRKLGYRLSISDRLEGVHRALQKLSQDYQSKDAHVMDSVGDLTGALLRLVLFFLL